MGEREHHVLLLLEPVGELISGHVQRLKRKMMLFDISAVIGVNQNTIIPDS